MEVRLLKCWVGQSVFRKTYRRTESAFQSNSCMNQVELAEQNWRDVSPTPWSSTQELAGPERVPREKFCGGHAAAAGADIPGVLSEIQPLVLKTTREMLGFNI